MSEWISVEDRLPPEMVYVYIYRNDTDTQVIAKRRYRGGGAWVWVSDNNFSLKRKNVTHWALMLGSPK